MSSGNEYSVVERTRGTKANEADEGVVFVLDNKSEGLQS